MDQVNRRQAIDAGGPSIGQAMTSLPYVLIVLFALNDGSFMVMRTSQGFASPLTCSMNAFLETETSKSRTYICVTRERANELAGRNTGLTAVHRDQAR